MVALAKVERQDVGSLLKKGHKKMDEKKVGEAIKAMKNQIAIIQKIPEYLGLKEKTDKQIEERQTAIEALEKQLPKKPKEMKYELLIEYGWKYACPTCGCACGENMYHYDVTKDDMFCTQCGQLLDWSE
jgi:hypothetical protein|uniref:Zinc-ribbon domain protein n=1 Tax=Siphoviridae sp. ctuy39 TaxID=2825719 RepID=A0A8S5VEE3_9CAUD|nr:MAG TPA: zinc-ribbon domain protein [Siphoviridae sp. ctuy39]